MGEMNGISADDVSLSIYNRKIHFPWGNDIIIYDSTLRDGEQMPGVAFTPEQKLDIAMLLDEIGIKEIEAGFPAISDREAKTVKMIAEQGLNARILALSRLRREDIDAAIKADVDVILLFIASSPLHLKYKLNLSIEEIERLIVDSIDYVKDHGITPSFSTEDSTRTSIDILKRFVKIAEETGAKRVGFTDTLGCATPEAIEFLFSEMYRFTSLPISAHLHNDFGLSLANAITALRSGARYACATVHGWGERAGNVPLEQLVMTLQYLYGIDLGIDTERLKELSDLVSRYAGIDVPKTQPFVGDNAFTHESGIHVAAVLRNPRTYEPVDPSIVGNRRRIILGKHSGRHVVETKLKELGIEVNDEELDIIMNKVKELGERKGEVKDDDLIKIIFKVRRSHE